MSNKSVTDRRSFLFRAAATAIAGGAVAACKDAAPKVAAATTLPPAKPALSAAETMDKMHEEGNKSVSSKDGWKGQSADGTTNRERREDLRAHRRKIPMGDGAWSDG
jgi:hypothetical protein